jgi:hypothetical protein
MKEVTQFESTNGYLNEAKALLEKASARNSLPIPETDYEDKIH